VPVRHQGRGRHSSRSSHPSWHHIDDADTGYFDETDARVKELLKHKMVDQRWAAFAGLIVTAAK